MVTVALTGGCGSDTDSILRPAQGSPPPADVPSSWLGLYEGSGVGSLDGISVEFGPARMSIRLDADTVLDTGCVRCLTVTLDTLFTKANVDPAAYTDLVLQDREGRTLELTRFSAVGPRSEVVSVRFRAPSIGPGRAAVDLSFVMKRR